MILLRNTRFEINNRISLAVFISAYISSALFLSFLIVKRPFWGTLLALGTVFAIFIARSLCFQTNPLKILILLIYLIPYSSTWLLNLQIIDVSGVKLLNLIAALWVFITIRNIKKAVRPPDYVLLFGMLIFMIFTVTFFRSVPNLNVFNYYTDDILTVQRYIISYYVKPLIFFMPGVIVILFCYMEDQVEQVIRAIVSSLLILSCIIIFIYSSFENRDMGAVRVFFATFFGLHTNSIVNMFILGVPLIVASCFGKKSPFNLVKILLPAIAVALLYSRSGYVLFLFSILSLLIMTKRMRYVPLIAIVGVIALLFISSSVIERSLVGFKSKKVNNVLAGRVDRLWTPLIKEYSGDYKKIMIGGGRYSIRFSKANRYGHILPAEHPHNMYLEQLLDAGLIGLAIFLTFYIKLLLKSISTGRFIPNSKMKDYHCAIIVSIICYLISGLTDRSFFPTPTNGFLWILLGLTISINRMYEPS